MAIALITAGGAGVRTGQKVPKQYLTVEDIPILLYTMKNIQDSNCYDELYVVCADGWKDFVLSYASQYSISIMKGTITGGKTRFESYSNGLRELSLTHGADEIVSIFDGNRPMTPLFIFEEAFDVIKDADCVIPLEACYDSMYYAENGKGKQVVRTLERDNIFKGQSPETTRLGVANEVCQNAQKDDKGDKTLTALMLEDGKKVLYTQGSPLNFKITTSHDFKLFKALNTITFKVDAI